MRNIRTLLIIPHMKIHNANTLSSPFTIGFPAMTAWLGAVHALQRKLNAKGYPASFTAVGVVSHKMDLQTYMGANDFVSSIVGTANPLDKNGARPAFIEEARCHLDVSLLVEYSGIEKDDERDFKHEISHLLNGGMRVAGGDIQTFDAIKIGRVEEGNDEDMVALTRQLMPGYALIERRDLMIHAMKERGENDAIDALLDFLSIHHISEKDGEGNVTWHSRRKSLSDKPTGWIVPIATGFHGISELGNAENQRDPEVPHRFAESIVTLGEFKIAYRFNTVNDFLWRYRFDSERRLYLCEQLTEGVTPALNNLSTSDLKDSYSIDNEFY